MPVDWHRYQKFILPFAAAYRTKPYSHADSLTSQQRGKMHSYVRYKSILSQITNQVKRNARILKTIRVHFLRIFLCSIHKTFTFYVYFCLFRRIFLDFP